MSDAYNATSQTLGGGSSLTDLVSTQKGGVQNLGLVAQSATALVAAVKVFQNVFPPATASSSPVFIGINNLGTTGTTVLNATTGLSGLIVHNPATANVNAYVYALSVATTPTLSAPGGSFIVFPGETVPLPAIFFANINVGWGAFVSTGTTGALTLVQFF